MHLDIRVPIGMMFTLLSLLLIATGVLQQTPPNTITGVIMFAFGASMWFYGRRATKPAAIAATHPSSKSAQSNP